MNLGLVMRSPKFRILLYIIIFGGACLVVMLLHHTHSRLEEVQNSFAMCQQEKEKCDQGKDSVSAQLQVHYEQKKRLEVTLQQERLNHQKEKEGFEKKSIETQAVHSQLQKEMNELQSKYSQLSSDYKSLKETNEQIQTELADMKESYASLEKEKQNLNLELSTQLQQLHQQEEEVNQLNGQLKMMFMEKQQIEQENTERIKKCEGNLVSCRKEHQQLLIQFDEVSLNLNNCITGKNNSKQEILHLSHEHMNQYVKDNIVQDAVEKTKHKEEQKDKSLHAAVGKKVRTRYSQNDYVVNRSPNSEHLFVHPNNQLHFDQNQQQSHLLPHLMNGVYGIPGDKSLDKPLYHRSGNYMQNELKFPHGNSVNGVQNKHSFNPKQNGVNAYHYFMPHPDGSLHELQVDDKANLVNQSNHSAIIHGHIVEQ